MALPWRNDGGLRTGCRGENLELRDEIMGKLRKLHTEDLHNLYSSPSDIRMITSWKMRWAGHLKGPLGKPRQRWGKDIKVILREIEWEARILFIWFRIGTNGGLSRTRNFGFHKLLGISCRSNCLLLKMNLTPCGLSVSCLLIVSTVVFST
jgi:hypothetical protein